MIEVEVKGLPELNARLVKIADGSMEAMKSGAYKTMSRVERMAKQLCPIGKVAGGLLRSSIHADILPDGAYCQTGFEKEVQYAKYVEYGTGIYATGPGGSRAKNIPWVYKSAKFGFITTSGNKPHPYFTPAVEDAMKYAEADMKEAVDKLVAST